MKNFSKKLIELLEKNKISSYKLAKDLKINESLITAWKKGTSVPGYENIIKLCEYFKISADDLLEININKNIIKEKKLNCFSNQNE